MRPRNPSQKNGLSHKIYGLLSHIDRFLCIFSLSNNRHKMLIVNTLMTSNTLKKSIISKPKIKKSRIYSESDPVFFKKY